jgi:hypothetical protein
LKLNPPCRHWQGADADLWSEAQRRGASASDRSGMMIAVLPESCVFLMRTLKFPSNRDKRAPASLVSKRP